MRDAGKLSNALAAPMTIDESCTMLRRLREATSRILLAARTDDLLHLLAELAEQARWVVEAPHAWAGTMNASSELVVAGAPTHESKIPTPPLEELLKIAEPTVSVGNFLGHAVLDPNGLREGILVVELDSGITAAQRDRTASALGSLAATASFALECVQLRVQAESAMPSLLSAAAHDLRGLLHIVMMSTSVLRDDFERDEVDAKSGMNLLARMDRGSVRMLALIDDLATAGQLTGGALIPAVRSESVATLLREAVSSTTQEMKAAYNEPQPTVAIADIEPTLRVVADRALTVQVLTKLLSVAAKSGGEGATVQLDATPHDSKVVFTIAVAYAGEPPTSPSSMNRGNNLALFLTERLLDLQNGSLETANGDGPTFSVSLPAAT